MGTKVTLITRPGNRVVVSSQAKQQVKSVNIVGATDIGTAGISRLSDLRDVDSTNVNNNETLVYDEASGKYVIKVLPIINGGTF